MVHGTDWSNICLTMTLILVRIPFFLPLTTTSQSSYLIAAADLTITKARAEAIDFLEPFMYTYSQLFIKNPTNSFHFKAFIKPYHMETWMVLALVTCVAPLFLFVAIRWPCKDTTIMINTFVQSVTVPDLEIQNQIVKSSPSSNVISSSYQL